MSEMSDCIYCCELLSYRLPIKHQVVMALEEAGEAHPVGVFGDTHLGSINTKKGHHPAGLLHLWSTHTENTKNTHINNLGRYSSAEIVQKNTNTLIQI